MKTLQPLGVIDVAFSTRPALQSRALAIKTVNPCDS